MHTSGADIAFDSRILPDYFASRLLHVKHIVIANKIATAFAKVKSAFAPNFAFAPIAA